MATVAIAGGGLAGLTCGKLLSDAGHAVRLFEEQPFLGGSAGTYKDADGDFIEQGLQLFLGPYTELQGLLASIGQPVHDVVSWMSEVRLQDPLGSEAVLGVSPVKAPLRTLRTVIGENDYLGPLDKLALLRLVAPGLRGLEQLERKYDQETVADLWARSGTDLRLLERVIRPLCRGIQFTEPEQFSAYAFLSWIHHVGFQLPRALLGGYRGNRDELIFQPLARYLRASGSEVRTGAGLRELLHERGAGTPGRIGGLVLEDGERIQADAYVLAMPVWEVMPLLPAPLLELQFFARLPDLPVAPAISLQLWFDRDVTEGSSDFTLVARSRGPVYQDQARSTYPFAGGSRLSFVIAPADQLLGASDDELTLEALGPLALVNPALRGARIIKRVVLRHERHLIRPLPGAMSARPDQATPVSNLFFAGDWTKQPFFGSHEGAVRGGQACAEQVLRELRGEAGAHP